MWGFDLWLLADKQPSNEWLVLITLSTSSLSSILYDDNYTDNDNDDDDIGVGEEDEYDIDDDDDNGDVD